MPAKIPYVLTADVYEAKVFKSYGAAYAAAKKAARERGIDAMDAGAGYLGDGRYVAHIHGRGWLRVAGRT